MTKLLLTAVTTFVAIAEALSNQCLFWILGQDEMPEDLIE